MLYNYFGKKILILGIGLTGISCIKFFLRKGIIPKVIDESKNPVYLNKIPKNIKYHLGDLEHKWILESDLIIISPGISSFKPILIKARLLGINIISDVELFAREATSPIIAITGTNGKSTVATIITKIAKNAGYNASLGGNIGFPVLKMLDKNYSLYIIELSSFQLENTFTLKPKISVILNISDDHINRYPEGFEQYKKVKLSIYKKSNICITNADDQLSIPDDKSKKWIIFGSYKNDYYISYHKNDTFFCHKKEKILNKNQILLHGNHNYNNILASLAISDEMKFPRNCAIDAICSFPGLPHRFQTIRHHKGMHWINDSKSTNVNSTKAALESLNIKGTIRLLLGGDKKDANFHSLNSVFKNLKIKIYCFGKDGAYLSKICEKKSICVNTLHQAMALISKEVLPGDTVILSPGCSSLDQFSNFEERGDCFIKLTKEIN